MVKETRNLGDPGGSAAGRTQDPQQGTGRQITVYESTRVIKNWEMMKIANTLSQHYPSMYRIVSELLTRQRAENIFEHYDKSCEGNPQGVYKVFLAWMDWKHGYGSLGEVCQALRKNGHEELAESFPP